MAYGRKLDECEVVGRELVVARCHTPAVRSRCDGWNRNVRFRDPQLGPSCNDVLDHPSERKDSSGRHSQCDDHDWKHDEESLDSMSAPRDFLGPDISGQPLLLT
jgi:hypothetical protein